MNIVEISHLNFSYPDGKKVLHDLSLQIDQGECLGLIGANGAGKTTLLLHLNGVLAGAGEIIILGKGLTKENLREIRSKVGLVFQDPDDQLFSATVFDDVSFGPLNLGLPEEKVILRTREALAQVGMGEFEQSQPHHLSLGERKSISIATILSLKPEILVLDEPTSNLDIRQRRNLMNLLRGIRVTKVIASHDLHLIADLCDRVILLNHGRVAATGTPKEILTDAELMEANGLESI